MVNQVGHLRLQAMGIADRRFSSSADVVGWHGAMQGQDLPGLLWSIALRRADKPTMREVRDSLNRERLVRSWPMRGTLHLVHPDSAEWMISTLAPRREATARTRARQLGLSDADIDVCRDAIGRALRTNDVLSRSDAYAVIEAEGVSTGKQRGYHLLAKFAREGLICLGPDLDGQPGFVPLRSWVGEHAKPEPPDPFAELAIRFVRSHGPASIADFARWADLPITRARAAFQAISECCAVTGNGDTAHWVMKCESGAKPVDSIYLLPGFDEFILGYRDRSQVVAPDRLDRLVPGGNGVFRATIVWGGQVVGLWRRTVSARSVKVSAEWWKSPTKSQLDAFDGACQEYADFLELSLHRPTK